MKKTNKRKIINDPVYGFLQIPYKIIYDLVEHPYFQRLRHIQQLGLSSYVYPGALHTRFHHALGASHLMTEAIEVLRYKKNKISKAEAQAVTIAILLHDIGHGPFSHALEHSLVGKVAHEALSLLFMQQLNEQFDGKLSLAINIFKGEYERRFLHDLVSSQLDMDRLDYLNRDSFFTGVQEGVIGCDRIIKMLNVRNNELVVEEKGIYSVEKFLIARRLMYWQVYLHKTVIAAEMMLLKVLQRARALTLMGEKVFATPALQFFLENEFTTAQFEQNPDLLDKYAALDDSDVFASIKAWQTHPDPILAALATGLVNRKLFAIELTRQPHNEKRIQQLKQKAAAAYRISPDDADYLIITGSTANSVYTYHDTRINILLKNGTVCDLTETSDYPNINALTLPVVKHYVCYPKVLG